MDKVLKLLFDYQRFEQNERLSVMLAKAEKAGSALLNDEELEWVAAAGELTAEEQERR